MNTVYLPAGEYMCATEYAERIGRTPITVFRQIRAEKLDAIKIGNVWLVKVG
jgi:hypothetical protein